MGGYATCLAPHGSKRPLALNVLGCVLWVPFKQNGSDLVVGPERPEAATDRAVAVSSLVGCRRKREANCAAVALTPERRYWLLFDHEGVLRVNVTPNVRINGRRQASR